MSEVPTEVRLQASAMAHLSWANTDDREARTAPGRRAAEERFLKLAGGDPVKAASLRKAFYQSMAAKSVAARRARKAGA